MALLATIGTVLAGLLILIGMAVLFGLAYLKNGEFPSIPFLLSVLLMGLLASLVLPWDVSVVPTFGLGQRSVIIGVAVVMVAWMVIGAWWRSSRGDPERVAGNVTRRFERLFSTWVAIIGLGISLGFSLLITVLGEGGEIAGVVGQAIADVPLISSNIGAIGLGWVGAGGSIPIVEETLPTAYQSPMFIAGAIAFIFVLAVGVTYAD